LVRSFDLRDGIPGGKDMPKFPCLIEQRRSGRMMPRQCRALSDKRLKPDFSLKFIGALGGLGDETATVDRFLIDFAIIVSRLQPRPLLVPKGDAFGRLTRELSHNLLIRLVESGILRRHFSLGTDAGLDRVAAGTGLTGPVLR
jgi:hypothetical protein